MDRSATITDRSANDKIVLQRKIIVMSSKVYSDSFKKIFVSSKGLNTALSIVRSLQNTHFNYKASYVYEVLCVYCTCACMHPFYTEVCTKKQGCM